jgi:hypothetical protein
LKASYTIINNDPMVLPVCSPVILFNVNRRRYRLDV